MTQDPPLSLPNMPLNVAAGCEQTPRCTYTTAPMQVPLFSRVLLSALIALLATQVSWTPVADAQTLIDRNRQPRVDGSSGISRDEAVSRAESRYRAKAVKVETIRDGGHIVYQIRLLNAEGKVWSVNVDAETGRMY